MSRAPRKRPDEEALPESDRFPDAPHPRETSALSGHRQAEAELLGAYQSGRLQHGWIIGGDAGIGKATLAYRFARFLMQHPDSHAAAAQAASSLAVPAESQAARLIAQASHPDLAVLRRDYDPKRKLFRTETSAGGTREALGIFRSTAAMGGWRILIADVAEDMNRSAANALLKLLEEPPGRGLLLLLSHAPTRLLPTLRSRCRMLKLRPLGVPDVLSVIRALPSCANETASALSDAAAASGGSVRQALTLLSGDLVPFQKSLSAALASLPDAAAADIQKIADQAAGRAGEQRMDLLLRACRDFISGALEQHCALPPARLAPLAEVWEKLQTSSREAEIYNLDRRPLVISIFAGLSAAVRQVRAPEGR